MLGLTHTEGQQLPLSEPQKHQQPSQTHCPSTQLSPSSHGGAQPDASVVVVVVVVLGQRSTEAVSHRSPFFVILHFRTPWWVVQHRKNPGFPQVERAAHLTTARRHSRGSAASARA